MSGHWYIVAKAVAADRKVGYQQLADRLGVAKSTVGHWLTGRNGATLDVIMEVARALDVPVTELIADDAYYLTDERERDLIDRYRKIPPELRRHAAAIFDSLADPTETDQKD
jgi:transcriptional regulator with XRE-family HTH domain